MQRRRAIRGVMNLHICFSTKCLPLILGTIIKSQLEVEFLGFSIIISFSKTVQQGFSLGTLVSSAPSCVNDLSQ